MSPILLRVNHQTNSGIANDLRVGIVELSTKIAFLKRDPWMQGKILQKREGNAISLAQLGLGVTGVSTKNGTFSENAALKNFQEFI